MSAAVSRDDVLTRLAAGIRQLTSSEAWTTWLEMQSRFYRYSFGNTLLIGLQRPDATQVAGFHRWKSLGRSVRKGSRGIAILAPVVRRLQVSDDNDDVSIVAAAPSAFRIVYVFDVADTEGRELPSVPCHPLRGDAPATLFERLAAVGESRGFTVGLHPMSDSRANGDTAFGERRIRVRDRLEPAQRVKTLAHELGHALLHEDSATDRALAELEAESVAFIVCEAVGIASDAYSFGYVASWMAGDANAAETALRASGSRITRAARTVLDEISGSPVQADPEIIGATAGGEEGRGTHEGLVRALPIAGDGQLSNRQ